MDLHHPRCLGGGIGLIFIMEGATTGEYTKEELFSLGFLREGKHQVSEEHIRGGRGRALAHRLYPLKPTHEFLEVVQQEAAGGSDLMDMNR